MTGPAQVAPHRVCRHRAALRTAAGTSSGQGSIVQARRQGGLLRPALHPEPRTPARAEAPRGGAGRADRILPPDASHPPLRGARRPALRPRTDRRLLPSLYRPGSGGGRAAVRSGAGPRQRHHRLSRPRPHARLRDRPAGDHGRADGPSRRHLEGQGRLDAHVQRRA